MMDRREFLKVSGVAAVGAAATGLAPLGAAPRRQKPERMKGHFILTQLSSTKDTIRNAYILRTKGGKVVLMDGGFGSEADNLRENILALGGKVDTWFISHPHMDHMEGFISILEDPRGIQVDKVVHSRLPDENLKLDPETETTRRFYKVLDRGLPGTDIIDLHRPGARLDIDGVGIKILGVANPELKSNAYNNSSMVIKVWDDTKSVIFLGDAGVECGGKLLAACPEELCCDYLQMAHHGQNGCSEEFYKAISFKACLWPTPSWVWNPTRPEHKHLKTFETRRWMDEIGIKEHHVSCLEKDWVLV